MTISATSKIDFLWKKVIFGATKSDTDVAKAGNNEAIASPLAAYSAQLWSQTSSTDIPSTPPGSTTSTVQLYLGASRIATVADTTSGAPTLRPTWTTGLTDWVPPTFGSGYAVSVFLGDPQTTGIQIFPGTNNEEWVFDYQAGVLTFPTNLPTGNAQWSNGVYIRGYRYIGTKGLVTGPTGPSITGPAGTNGPTGPASTVLGPTGPTGPSITGPTGPSSTVPGPTGPGGSGLVLYKESFVNAPSLTATGANSIALNNGASADLAGQISMSSGNFSNNGDAQRGFYTLRNITTNAIITELYLEGASDKLIMADSCTLGFMIRVVARRTDSTNQSAVYEFRGAISRESGASSTRLVGKINKTIIAEDIAAWDANVDANTLNGALRIRVSGENSKTIRWVATVDTTEVRN